MKIFGIGLSKTGTTSLTKALNILGIKSVHGPCDQITQQEFKSGNYNLTILQKYDAILDIPTSNFYQEFDIVYPNSKFIFTNRNLDSWLKSMEKHYSTRPPENNDWRIFIRSVTYGCIHFNELRHRIAFKNHEKYVREYFSNKNNFMEINITNGEGWEKLCNFLNKPIPKDLPFPFLNKSKIPLN